MRQVAHPKTKINYPFSIRKEYLFILFLFIITRLLLSGIAEYSITQSDFGAPFRSMSWPERHWGRWDSYWYYDIATNGYDPEPSQYVSQSGQSNFAFFPGYPLLMGGVGWVFGGEVALAGWLISNIFLLATSFLFFSFIRKLFGSSIAWWSVIFFYSWPTQFMMSAILSESLYLTFSLSAFISIHARRFLFASFLGSFAVLARLTGVLLFPAFIVECLERTSSPEKRWLWFLFLFIPLGGFLYYNMISTGDPLYFIHIQDAWSRHGILSSFLNYSSYHEIVFTIIPLVLLIIGIRFVPMSWIVYCLFSIGLVIVSGSLVSMGRYVLVLFPLFVILAHVVRHIVLRLLLACGLFVTQLFFMYLWVIKHGMIF